MQVKGIAFTVWAYNISVPAGCEISSKDLAAPVTKAYLKAQDVLESMGFGRNPFVDGLNCKPTQRPSWTLLLFMLLPPFIGSIGYCVMVCRRARRAHRLEPLLEMMAPAQVN